MTLPNATLFPQAMLPLYIFEPRYRKMLEEALASHRMFSVAMQKPGIKRESPCPVAGLGLIRASVKNKDGTSHLILQGLARIRFEETICRKPYRVERFHTLMPGENESVAVDALTTKVRELVTHRVEISKKQPSPDASPQMPSLEQFAEHLNKVNDPDQVADMAACVMLREPAQRQSILEAVELEPRLRLLVQFLVAQDKPSGNDAWKPE